MNYIFWGVIVFSFLEGRLVWVFREVIRKYVALMNSWKDCDSLFGDLVLFFSLLDYTIYDL